MRREEFVKLFGKPGDAEVKEVNVLKVVVFVDFIYNQMLNMQRNLPVEYKIEAGAIWANAVEEQFEKDEKEIIKEAIEKNKLVKALIEEGYELKAKIHIVPQYTINSDTHGWKRYVEFEIPIEVMHVYWGQRYKQKIFVFSKKGVYELKYPPYSIRDDASPYGVYPGVLSRKEEIIINE